MTNEILEAIQALEKVILQQATTDRKDNRFLQTLGYYKRAKGVTTNRKEGSVGIIMESDAYLTVVVINNNIDHYGQILSLYAYCWLGVLISLPN